MAFGILQLEKRPTKDTPASKSVRIPGKLSRQKKSEINLPPPYFTVREQGNPDRTKTKASTKSPTEAQCNVLSNSDGQLM